MFHLSMKLSDKFDAQANQLSSEVLQNQFKGQVFNVLQNNW